MWGGGKTITRKESVNQRKMNGEGNSEYKIIVSDRDIEKIR